MNRPTFYFTVHPGDMTRARLPKGAAVMIVASALWGDDRKRFRIRRPPADHIGGLCIDSGGFTAAKRWGRYPWTFEQYADFVREESRDMALDFAASMDYACEREVNRETYRTNAERIHRTIENELALREQAPQLPWLGVLQGNTLDERVHDIEQRRALGLLRPIMGIGSICRRQAREAAGVLRFYAEHLPGSRFHAFGLDIRTLDAGDDIVPLVSSWDSYAWNWPRGEKAHRPTFLLKGEGESRSAFMLRCAEVYQRETVGWRLDQPRQLVLEVTS